MKIKAISLKGIGLGLAAVVSMLAIQLIVSSSTFAAVKTWDGDGTDDLFSTGANWNGDTAPITGDSLVFPTVAGGPFVMTNDLNSGGTTFIGVSVTGSTNYSVDSITLSTGSVDVTSTGTFAVTAGLASNGALTLDGNDLLTIGALTVGGDLTVSSPFDATSVDLATTIASMATDFNVTSTLQVDGSLTLSQDITVGALSVDGNLSVTAPNFQVTNGITVGGNLTMTGTPIITTAGPINVTGNATFTNTFVGAPAINVDGDATISSALTAGAVDVTGALTVGAAFAASSTSAGSFIVNSSFNGGAITSNADLTTGAFTVTATTLSFPFGSLLTVSSGGSVVASISITVGDTSGDTTARVSAVSGSTINTPSITIHGNAGSPSSLAGALTGTPVISLPNAGGALTLSPTGTPTLGAVTVTGALTVSGTFTAATVTAGSFAGITANFTSTGLLTSNASLTIPLSRTVTAGSVSLPITNSDLTVTGTLIVSGNITAAGVITSTGTITTNATSTIQANGSGATSIGGTINGSSTPTISVPNGSLTLSTGSTVGAVTNGTGGITASGTFTAASILTTGVLAADAAFTVSGNAVADSLTMSSNFTVNGNLTSNSTSALLNISRVISGVDTLDAKASLTISSGGSIAASVSILVAGTLTTSTGAVTVSAPTIDVTGAASLSTTVTVTTLLSVDGVITLNAGASIVATGATVTTLSSFTASQSVAALVLNVTGDLVVSGGTFNVTTVNVLGGTGSDFTASTNFTATTVNVTGNATLTGSHSTAHKFDIDGTLTIGNGTLTSSATLNDTTVVTGVVTVEASGLLQYATSATNINFGSLVVKNGGNARLEGTINYPVTFGSGTSISLPSLTSNNSSSYTFTPSPDSYLVYTSLKFTGAVTLLNDLQLSITGTAYGGAVEFAGALTFNNYTIRKSVSTSGKLIIAGVEVRNPSSVNEYTGVLPGNSVTVGDNDVAVITGTRGTVTAYRGGFVKGTGQIVNLDLRYGSTVSPGNSPGKLTILNILDLADGAYANDPNGATYYAELKSTSEYDQLVAGQEYTSPSGSPVLLSGYASLNVVLSEGFNIAQGNKFTIIDNKSSRPVTGTFKNLAEGTVFSVADGTFSISYVGGDGNDVVLTVVSAPTPPVQAPNTGFRVLANPAVVLGLGIITAGFFLVMAMRRQVQPTRY